MSIPFVLLGQSFSSFITCLILLGFAVFLILLVLVQRGKGGGLSGAFGGMGGQSAFGTKAGDTFTRITVVTATLWILFCIVSAKYLGTSKTSRFASAQSGATTTVVPGVNGNPAPGGVTTDGTLGASLGSDELGTGESTTPEGDAPAGDAPAGVTDASTADQSEAATDN